MHKYTVHGIWREGLLLKRNGRPYMDRTAISRRIREAGFSRTGLDDKGNKIYEISVEDIKRMNNAVNCSTCHGKGYTLHPDGPDDNYSETCSECQ